MKDIEKLEKKLKGVEKEIAAVKSRMPAHSVKQPIMMELLELEDRRDELFSRLILLKRRNKKE